MSVTPVIDNETSTTLEIVTENDTPEFSHYVLPPNPATHTPSSWIAFAMINKIPVVAICGFSWVPTKNPAGLPVCPDCLDEAERRIKKSSGNVPDDASGL